ncbi:MAG: hypothetical protein WA921_08510, partial [Ahrensia sp.]
SFNAANLWEISNHSLAAKRERDSFGTAKAGRGAMCVFVRYGLTYPHPTSLRSATFSRQAGEGVIGHSSLLFNDALSLRHSGAAQRNPESRDESLGSLMEMWGRE